MQILMLSPHYPWPLHSGWAIRIFKIVKELNGLGHQVTLLSGNDDSHILRANPLDEVCKDIYLYEVPHRSRVKAATRSLFSRLPYQCVKFYGEQLKEKLNALIQDEEFDLLWINWMYMTFYLNFDLLNNTAIVVDEHESTELLWKQYLSEGTLAQRLFVPIDMAKIRRMQKRIYPHIEAVISVSEQEASALREQVPEYVKVLVGPNGVDFDYYAQTPVSRDRGNVIMMSGGWMVYRNVEAALWFAKDIFPEIRRSIPDAEFWIVGAGPPQELLNLRSTDGIVVTGRVEDIREYFAKARVFVSPYRFGMGTKLKVLEWMAMGIPIVSTEMGCLGIDVKDGEHLFIANDEGSFAEAVVEVLSNEQLSKRLVNSAKRLANDRYTWKSIMANLEPALKQLVTTGDQTRRYPE